MIYISLCFKIELNGLLKSNITNKTYKAHTCYELSDRMHLMIFLIS